MKNIIHFYEKGSVEIVYGKSTHSFPLHSHESFCVGVIINGSALFNINNTSCLLKESMTFIIPSNTGISITADSEYNYITLCFKNNLKDQVANIKFSKYFVQLKSTKEMLVLCDKFKRSNNEKDFLSSILELIGDAIEPSYSIDESKTNETVLLICKYIKKNAAQRFNLDELAKSFYFSKYHLIRIFKKEMGVTPNQYYIQEKLRIAKLKIFNEKSETNLAYNLNLSDQSHLCNLFKRQMGVSIQDYKKNLIKK